MSAITIYIDDDRPDLTDTITFTGSPSLSGATVTFSAATKDGTKTVDDQDCSVDIDDDEDTIEWTYEIQDGDFDTVGLYYGWLTVTFADGDVQTVATDSDGDDLLIQVKQPYG